MGGEGGYIGYEECGRAGELRLAAPSYGHRGRGARIFFATAEAALGRILVAATRTGVCWMGIHGDEAHLEAELRSDLPLAMIQRDDIAAGDFARRVIAYMDGAALGLPLDIQATPFQAMVWRELCAIPFGATRSYGEIARRIGRENSSRAVGHANGSNPVAVVIPCHRVIGSGGSLTGYRWGVEYKGSLLAHEMELARRLAATAAPSTLGVLADRI
jgi:AraC family transcriptional regulator of adaptative response/methylated-DNA-[protein]-cysteine methyltransferase